MKEIHRLVIPVLPQSRSAPSGVAAEGFYFVQDGKVHMCDEHGTRTGDGQDLGHGDNPRVIAGRMIKRIWEDGQGSDFDRPLGHAAYERWRY